MILEIRLVHTFGSACDWVSSCILTVSGEEITINEAAECGLVKAGEKFRGESNGFCYSIYRDVEPLCQGLSVRVYSAGVNGDSHRPKTFPLLTKEEEAKEEAERLLRQKQQEERYATQEALRQELIQQLYQVGHRFARCPQTYNGSYTVSHCQFLLKKELAIIEAREAMKKPATNRRRRTHRRGSPAM